MQTQKKTSQNIDFSSLDTVYKGKIPRLNICACYSWEMALNFTLDVSFDKMQEWKTIRENRGS
jgi:hypothetical protein